MIRTLFIRHGTESKRERTTMEKVYYETMYDLIQWPIPHEEEICHTKISQSENHATSALRTTENPP
jgi:hypothetical protein